MTSSRPASDPSKENRLNAIIAECLRRKDAGQPVDHDQLLLAYPDLKDELQSWFKGEALLTGQNQPVKRSPRESRPTDMRDTSHPRTDEFDTASEFNARRFGRYRLLRLLGEGAMGSVYLANDSTLDRQVALKTPKTEGSGDAEFMLRFMREARAAAALRHENICSVFDAGEHEGVAYITMDYIDGVPLSRFVASSKLSSLDSILTMIHTIADAVGHAHHNGVVHRDLKPGNIIVDSEMKPFVTDFGLARRINTDDESRITQEGLLIGTPAYMAPEQIKGQQAKVGPRSDIYSLGVIFFELLTARLPFEGSVVELLTKSLRDDPPVPSRIRKDLPEDVDDICLKMLKKDPNERYASMEDVKAAVKQLQQKLSVQEAAAAGGSSALEKYKAHIGGMLKHGQYAEAMQHLREMTTDTRPESKPLAEWARKKLPAVKKESAALSPSGLKALLGTADAMFRNHDYRGCIQLLEDVPEIRRTNEIEDLLRRAEQLEIKAEQLLLEIKTLERQETVAGLESTIKKFLKLKPGNKYAKQLLEALQTYSRLPPAQRRYHFQNGRLQPMPRGSMFWPWVLTAVAVGLLVFGCVYSYTIFYLNSGQQTLAVHVDDEWLESQGGVLTLSVDGNDYTLSSNPEGSQPISVSVSFGEHSFSVSQGDTVVHAPKTFEITKDGRRVLYISPAEIQLLNRPKENQLVADQPETNDTSDEKQAVTVAARPASSKRPMLAKTPFLPAEAYQSQQDWAQYVGEPVEYTNSCGMKLKLIPAGEFLRGSADNEEPRFENEGPQHRVRLTDPYYLGVMEVTQKHWLDVMGTKPWEGVGAAGDDQPIAFINRIEAEEFCRKLSEREQHTYRLPTEAEWEFACRGGTQLPYGFASFPARLREFAWFEGTIYGDFNPPEEPGPQPVARKEANVFGLYDIQGNMFEWCHDSYSDSYQPDADISINPVNRSDSKFGIVRGGSWANPEFDCRPTTRGKYEITNRGGGYMGFRVMRVINASQPATKTEMASQPESVPDRKKRPEPPAPLSAPELDEAENDRLNAKLTLVTQVHGANEDQLNRWANSLPKTHRPYWISIRSAGEEILFDALARHAPTQIDWKLASITVNTGEFEKVRVGYGPVIINGWRQDGVMRQHLMLQRHIPGGEFWFGGNEYIGKRIKDGFANITTDAGDVHYVIPTYLSSMRLNGGMHNHLCMAHGPYSKGEFITDLPMGKVGSLLMGYHKKGWRLHLLAGIRDSAEPRYNAIFVPNEGPDGPFRKWAVSPRLTISQYQEILLKIDGMGGRPRCVTSTIEDGRVIYRVVWDGIPQTELKTIRIFSDPDSPTDRAHL